MCKSYYRSQVEAQAWLYGAAAMVSAVNMIIVMIVNKFARYEKCVFHARPKHGGSPSAVTRRCEDNLHS